MRKKVICHLIASGLTNHGPSNIIVPIAARSNQDRFQMHVWLLYPPPVSRDPKDIICSAGAGYQVFRMKSFLDVRILMPLVGQLRALKPDILHCHLVRANLYGRIAARLAGVPVVICTHHGVDDYTVSDHWRDRIVRGVERLTDRWVTCHVAVSEDMRRAAIRYHGIASSKIVAIPNGVDIDLYMRQQDKRNAVRQDLGLEPDALVVGSVGNFNSIKNFKLLVHIAKSITDNHDGVQFLIVGEGDQHHEVKVLVDELGLTHKVILPGFRADIPRILSALDIFALTSRSEGFCLAIAEAMASELPCVAFDVGALNELVVDNQTGFLVSADDSEAFCVALKRLITTPALRSSMGDAAHRRARELFSVEHMVWRYNDLYERLVAKFC